MAKTNLLQLAIGFADTLVGLAPRLITGPLLPWQTYKSYTDVMAIYGPGTASLSTEDKAELDFIMSMAFAAYPGWSGEAARPLMLSMIRAQLPTTDA